MSNAGAAVAALRMRAERQLLDALRSKNAHSAAFATALDLTGGMEFSVLRSLQKKGAIVESEPGRYWLDEPVYAALKKRRQTMMLAVAGFFFGVMMVIAAVGLINGR